VHQSVEELVDLSRLNDEQLRAAIRIAEENLKNRKNNLDEFVREGAHDRIIQYSHLHFLFAQAIVAGLKAESNHRFGPDLQVRP
jgi:hypothetical protein